MKRVVALSLLALTLSLGACSNYTLQEPTRVEVAGFYTVDPQIPWSRRKAGFIELWTIDGPILESVRFFDPRKDGDTLFVGAPGQKLPAFEKTMTAFDVQELVVDSLAAIGAVGVEAANLRPWAFGSLDGFRFDLDFVDDAGLEHDGIVVGAVASDQLYLIMYTGTRKYYFPKYRGYFESIVASVELAV